MAADVEEAPEMDGIDTHSLIQVGMVVHDLDSKVTAWSALVGAC
jgi:hypothetical protein